jgi:hypothetical protein
MHIELAKHVMRQSWFRWREGMLAVLPSAGVHLRVDRTGKLPVGAVPVLSDPATRGWIEEDIWAAGIVIRTEYLVVQRIRRWVATPEWLVAGEPRRSWEEALADAAWAIDARGDRLSQLKNAQPVELPVEVSP